ncbi:hypothetical protein DFJ63DRAFT_288581 [Scheffersomyces coipomensis]|uniref:uncharacterized protein n=1 Tax=Scheffersomyces coipomensis TaxID=1788519 RepID=UPI00315DCCD4
MNVSNHSIDSEIPQSSSLQIQSEALLESNHLHRFIDNYILSLLESSEIKLSNETTSVNTILASFINSLNEDTLFIIIKSQLNQYYIFNELTDFDSFYSDKTQCSLLLFIKSQGKLSSNHPLSQQLNILTISSTHNKSTNNDTPDESDIPDTEDNSKMEMLNKLRSLINFGLIPYFDLLTYNNKTSQQENNNNGDHELENKFLKTKNKFNELSLSLQHIHQKIQVPNLLQTIHPKIYEILQHQDEDQDEVDTNFLNELTTIVNNWTKQIQSITKLSHDPFDDDSIVDEKEFWDSMELTSLSIINQITNSPEISKTIEILNNNKRFQVTISFQNDSGLNDKVSVSKLYNSILKELPIYELISCTNDDLNKFETIITNLFNYLKLKVKNLNSSIKLNRIIKYIELVLNDIVKKLNLIVLEMNLTSIDFNRFINLFETKILTIFDVIDKNLKFLINLIRELLRKRQEKFMIIQFDKTSFNKLIQSIESFKTFRINHQNLLNLLSIIQQEQAIDSSFHLHSQLIESYNTFILSSNPFDLSKQGEIIWSMNSKNYLEVYNNLYLNISNILNNLFSSCHSFNQFLIIFEKFNNIEINYLINDEIKLKVLSIINNEIDNLMALNLNANYTKSFNHSQSDLIRGSEANTSIVSEINWNFSLINKLNFYLIKLNDLLGSNWNNYSIGVKINSNINSLLQKLNPQLLFDNWINQVSRTMEDFEDSCLNNSTILKITPNDEILVNFDFQLLNYNQQINKLTKLNHFKIPIELVLKFKKINKLYPIIIDLIEAIECFKHIFTVELVSTDYGNKFGFLIENVKEKILVNLKSIVKVNWKDILNGLDLFSIKDYKFDSVDNNSLIEVKSLHHLNQFQLEISHLYQSLNDLNKFNQFLQQQYYELKICQYEFKSIQSIIETIQLKINQMSIDLNKSQLNELCQSVNSELELILINKCYERLEPSLPLLEAPVDHNLVFEDQSFIIKPDLSTTKSNIFDSINSIMSVIENQSQILTSLETKHMFKDIITNKHNEKLVNQIHSAYSRVDTIINQCQDYFQKWSLLQNLWELNLNSDDDLQKILPSNVSFESLIESINSVVKLRELFDNSESIIVFSNLISINFHNVQSRVILKFDTFQVELIKKFSSRYQQEIIKVHNSLINCKSSLEIKLNFFTTKISQLILDINNYLNFKINNYKKWQLNLSTFKLGQTFLFKHRFKFSSSWLYVEQLDNDLSIINSLLLKKEKLLEDNFELLVPKIKSEAIRINESIKSLTNDWNSKRPIAANLLPSLALVDLNNFQTSCNILSNNAEALSFVADQLNVATVKVESLFEISHDIKQLKSVWLSINTLWEELESIKATTWKNVEPPTVRHKLADLLNNSRLLPSDVRQYSAFEEIQNQITLHLQTFSLITDLSGESMKQRHWLSLINQLGLSAANINVESFTIGDVWNFNFSLNFNVITAIVTQANNEQIIESKLSSIQSEWINIRYELFNYGDKIKLLKNWDKLFDQCNNDINSLSSMKNSPYYTNFESEITALEDKLISLFSLLDVWIEVQRQWVYLDGVFGNGNSDINTLLPIESNRFTNITYEYFTLLKRIYKNSLIIEVLSITDISKIFINFSVNLNKLRKSLSDYLEKQRELFPRFYFVGNEDLLDIIGGSNEISRVNRHLSKMFSGVSSVEYDAVSSSITAIWSEQNECVQLFNSVSIKLKKLHEWLHDLDQEIKLTLSLLVKQAIGESKVIIDNATDGAALNSFIDKFPAQVLTVASQINFTTMLDENLSSKQFQKLSASYDLFIKQLIKMICSNIVPLQRKKIEYLVIEIIHHRDICVDLSNSRTNSEIEFTKSIQQCFYYDENHRDARKALVVKQADGEFTYGFEYLGIPEKLAYTPLIEKCFLTMSLALKQKLGGSPFGPAGTGKTESIKALGCNLGKMVIVFCCDETFDFQSIGRIFLGLSKIGCWGCFDEFNRLDERVLSSISSQIEAIERGLKDNKAKVDIAGHLTNVHSEVGIFVTMNPGYAGRSELPENLKKQFRSISMVEPDRENIVEVLLTAQAFLHAGDISKIIVPFFLELSNATSSQQHYDFGLRALKATLVRCGAKRRVFNNVSLDSKDLELSLLFQSVKETIAPKLIKEDLNILDTLEKKFFPDVVYNNLDSKSLTSKIREYYTYRGLSFDDNWITKTLQVFQIQSSHHGIMLVGDSGTGKSTVWRSVLSAIAMKENTESLSYIIDSKVLSKDQLYGFLDPVTREWTDGLFTEILRKIRDNLKGELSKKVWIVFDGDIDPEWAENLNSVLDDNKILTLSNGERLAIPPNVRLLFEVDNIKHATPATISRCGIVWFDKSLVSLDSLFQKLVFSLSHQPLDFEEEVTDRVEVLQMQKEFVDGCASILNSQQLNLLIKEAEKLEHIMDFTIFRAFESFTTLLKSYCRKYVLFLIKRTQNSTDAVNIQRYIGKCLLLSVVWAFAGDCNPSDREKFSIFAANIEGVSFLDSVKGTIFELDVTLPDGDWRNWNTQVQAIELEPQHVMSPSTIIPTQDTVIHENLIYSVINEHGPLLLCGPPGSGKTMSLLEALRKSPKLELLSLNFSKEMSPQSLLQSMEQICTYKQTANGIQISPENKGKWLVVFCDEINLPANDHYGTQKVISFMRQMIEHGGFWRPKDRQWVSILNIQFVGACNSPKDPGRNPLSNRFIRHSTLIMVDYPGKTSLQQIYSTFNLAILKFAPDLRGFAKSLTEAMIEVYLQTKVKLGFALHSHYIYSPRELTRWTRGMLEALKSHNYTTLSALTRLWYHEGLRLFYDRLVGEEEKQWTKELFEQVIDSYFPNLDKQITLKSPILYSNWLTSEYEPVIESDLRVFIIEKLRIFKEEICEVDLVLHEDLLDHCLRIDRVLRQPQGHMILVGPSASGKSTLTKFVAWMNGLKLITLNVNRNYQLADFDFTLRNVLTKCARGEKICFIIDESNILETSFVERMNTLLANAEIPGLFEGEDYTALMNLCLEQSHSQGLLLDSKDELYRWFTEQISENLHVVFNISDTTDGLSPAIISSPALFNRCVLSWMGDWSDMTLMTLGTKMIEQVPLDVSNYAVPQGYNPYLTVEISGFREVIIDVLVFIHRVSIEHSVTLVYKKTPSDFMSLVKQFISLFEEKQSSLEDIQRHTTTGLDKLKEAVLVVNTLKAELSEKQTYLAAKDKQAKVVLNKMLTEQNEAERKHEFSVVTQEELSKQEVEIRNRKEVVLRDLELAEPAVLEAQRGVQNIKKQHLTEIRSMSSPPDGVKLTMESVCILLGYEVSTWRDVQLVIRRDDFIPNIVNFDNEQHLTSDLRAHMQKAYLSRKDFNYEAVHRASKACGPLLQWVIAQLVYSEILEKVGPLRNEVRELESRTKQTRIQLIAIDQMIQELEDGIEKYKEDYSSLIRESENIKLEMKTVEKKIERSLKLIKNLTGERERWKSSILRFSESREKLVGDSVLAAAFVVYAGLYDEKGREKLMHLWQTKLDSCGVIYDQVFSVFSYFWNSRDKSKLIQLNKDDLHNENFTILKVADIPLLIDPTSSILDSIKSVYSPKTVIITSFLNEGYLKQLENALRFGGVIILQDAEYYDPAIDSILRKDIERNGSRSVVKLGKNVIDYSPEFKLLLHTKDAGVKMLPFVSARTTVVNFTVTSGSLENRLLNLTLQQIKPEVEKKRVEIVRLQGEYHTRLHNLEEDLLSSLNSASGNLLDNDDVVDKLEFIKQDASDIDEKLNETGKVVELIETSRIEYSELAKHSAYLFHLVEELNGLHKLYKFSLLGFISIFNNLLFTTGNKFSPSEFVNQIYVEIFAAISTSLKSNDKIAFALGLVSAFNKLSIDESFERAISYITNAVITESKEQLEIAIDSLDTVDGKTVEILSPLVKSLESSEKGLGYIQGITSLSKNLFSGKGDYTSKYELKYWTQNLVDNRYPILLLSPEGFEGSFKVQDLADEAKKELRVISMGSKESQELADLAISTGIKNGDWVVIQNVQMSPEWLNHLEQRLEGKSNCHSNFVLFLTANYNANIPVGLVSKSKIISIENKPTFKTILFETFSSINVENESNEFKHLFFLTCWLHSLIVLRLNYAPMSFNKQYDINDSDFKSAVSVLRSISLQRIPWQKLSYIIGEITYCGKVDIESDRVYIIERSSYLFREESTNAQFNLIHNQSDKLIIPKSNYMDWIIQLPNETPLLWVDIDEKIDLSYKNKQGKSVAEKFIRLIRK